MTRLGAFEVGGVVVLPHALAQARGRWGTELDRLDDRHARQEIARQVREAVAAGFVHDRKPRGFRYAGDNGKGVMPWQRFVHSPDGRRGFVIALDQPPDITVVTCLVRQAKVRRR